MPKYAHAHLGFTLRGDERLRLERGRPLDELRGDRELVVLMLRIPEDEALRGRTWQLGQAYEAQLRKAGDPSARPRSLRKRARIAGMVRHVTREIGWTLTPAEQAMIAEIEQDRTIDRLAA